MGEEVEEFKRRVGRRLDENLALLVVVLQINSVLILSLVDGEHANTTLGNALLSK
jgi:hypothetical protein